MVAGKNGRAVPAKVRAAVLMCSLNVLSACVEHDDARVHAWAPSPCRYTQPPSVPVGRLLLLSQTLMHDSMSPAGLHAYAYNRSLHPRCLVILLRTPS